MKSIVSILVWLFAALLALGVGARFFFMPASTGAEMGLSVGSALGGSTLRGDIGGTFIAMGIVTVLAIVRRQPVYLEVVAVLIAGVAAGRALSLVADGFDATGLGGMVVEVMIVAVMWTRAKQMRAEQPGERAA